ncbi:MAG TPA: LysR family transcriptional regulator [Stellaceae bacterium]|nr:LysR family transcriptional regulator [Stellaceae bacterium]
MEMQEIRYFLAMSRTVNFTRAAEECHVSQPALTRAIRKMEDELGGLLFSREPNNTHMTELGRLIEPHLSEIMAQAGQAKQTATRFLKLEGASLSVGVMCTVAPVQFVSFLGRFRADNPGIEITLLEGMPDQLCDLLAKGELGVALMARPDGFSAPLQASKLYSELFVIACSAGHRFAMENEIRMADLDGEFYLSRINCEFYDVLDDLCREHGSEPREIVSKRARRLDPHNGGCRDGSLLPARIYSHLPGCRWVPGRIACGRAQRLPGQRRRPSLVTAGRSFRKSGAASSLAIGVSRSQSARNPAKVGCRRLTRFMAEVMSSAYRPYTLATFPQQRRAPWICFVGNTLET